MNRVFATPSNFVFGVQYLAKSVAPLAPWAAPGAVVVGWLAWPALTPEYKEETFGVKAPSAAGVAPAAGTSNFRTTKYVKNEIGERPSVDDE
ncbi:hypothetical protein H257_06326 [Aphanomyces astaci]|uniref:Uncharacterized protein n=1 Tax=Aphanomyces astaci TaxID=112090 RepID=W4GMD5_APHAT|nr:hypothetical protein H257_06326 [Aphanomyces astaci]ETV80870.1 hypothetical protein H257_06326 [Aphanomyces astaci]|eukprot:XP_009829817.1 hypothetical protein H257_06326 [Aphanomyces astaci]